MRNHRPRRAAGGAAFLLIASTLTLGACATNPAAPGFDHAGSDASAVARADDVMKTMGGRKAWDETRIVSWSFFGNRRHLWDRHLGIDRVEGTNRETDASYITVVNIEARTGVAWVDGEVVTDPVRLDDMLQSAYEAWVNDSYWLVMPYKLKDSGVTLRDLGERAMLDGRTADVLELTFSEVGVTPQNRYEVYVARDSGLVEQWDFFSKREDEQPRFQIPWHDWQPQGRILLSGDRGRTRLTDITVRDGVPQSAFTSPEPFSLD